MKKRISVIVMALILCVGSTFSVFAADAETGQIDEMKKDILIESHMEDLQDGRVEPINEHKSADIKVITGEIENKASKDVNQLNSEDNVELVDRKTELDIISLDKEKKEYLATAIVKDKYKITTMVGKEANTRSSVTKNESYCDITCVYSVTYDMYTKGGAERYKVTGYKASTKSTDPQITCTKINFRHRACGLMYTAPTTLHSSTNYHPADKAVSSPVSGQNYSYNISQPGYVEVPPGFSAGRLDVYAKRTVSSWTGSSYIALDFGEPINPWQ